ncbi:hypothetical protein AJ85_17185 [Alkalihalobacillus alcalophilus ATCC 27647 = CGMCC 1.3604]|uniref:Uncharacterized protein n=1 Tax=Alkalihalobacillus alcalophilus ATCC 27647 = CGMCC 1.3604 TaxID=1218173 RepID=A0A4S4K346_ALKAL|nr:hypothetical protein [Alkalihalobacillus alcalophilus]MED1563963.1 hypothetical protein [Alkalihalobacillus alcalophilus]THG92096.1 hypothetical protein AJ85_17185 [Alkalihalobacillus alcalophilus ATCC 27647 = CGMCC 1.3604]
MTVQNHTKDIFTVRVKSDDEDNGWIYHYRWSHLKDSSKIELGGYLGVKLDQLSY